MSIAPPPPSKDYLASVGKDQDGNPINTDPEANVSPGVVIVVVFFGLIATAGWICFATGFDSFLTTKNVCGGSPEVMEMSLVARLFRCSTGGPSALAVLWEWARSMATTSKDASKKGPAETGAKTMLLAPLVYTGAYALSSLIGGFGTAKLTYEYFTTPDSSNIVSQALDGMFSWPLFIIGIIAAAYTFFFGMAAVPFEISLRAFSHIFTCEDCGPATMTFGAGMVSYAFMAMALLGGLQLGVTGDDTVVPIVAIVLLLLMPFVCSFVFAR